jgi:hypothetical protein
VVQDFRVLSQLEIDLKRDLKSRLLGLAAVEKLRAKQKSRLFSIRAVEANKKLFYLQANGQRRKNTIHSLQLEDGVAYSHEDKARALHQHYSSHFGTPEPRSATLNWDELGIAMRDLSHLEEPFSEEEVRATMHDFASEKAPGPDGFIGIFLKTNWDFLREDIMRAFLFFHQQHEQHLRLLNTAHLVLIPKKPDAKCIADYRPISLSHSIAELISKCLASRLSVELNSLVSRARSAFIKHRSTQDNFLYTQNLIRTLHRSK